MAMLVLPDVFERTWGARPQPFWPNTIKQVRAARRFRFHGGGVLGHGSGR